MEKEYLKNYVLSIKRDLGYIQYCEDIEPEIKAAINSFVNWLYCENYSLARISSYATKFRVVGKIPKKLSLADEDKLDFLAKIRELPKISDTTKDMYRTTYCMLLQHHFKLDRDDPRLKCFRVRKRRDYKQLPDEMLNFEDINKIANEAHSNIRNKAFIKVLYETGGRIGEILPVKFGDVSFDKFGAMLNIQNSKTFKRKIRLVFSTPTLTQWVEQHPTKKPEDPLWISFNKIPDKKGYARLSYEYIRRIFCEYAKRAGIKKRVNFHNFRRSRATELSRSLSDQQLKQYFGWSRNSNMACVYVHLNNADLDKSILAISGIKIDDQPEQKTHIICGNCSTINTIESKFCNKCGCPLKEQEIKDLNTLQADIITSGLSLKDYVEKNANKEFPAIVEQLVKLNKEILEKLKEQSIK